MSTSSSSSIPNIPSPEAFIRFRFSDIDTVQSYTLSEYDVRSSPFYNGEELRVVPKLRIFGATDHGQRVVAHIHGVFPYLYVEYKGKLDADSVNAYIYRIGRSLNQVITDSYTINAKKKETPQYIAFITLCKGTPFYGYSIGYKQYLKIYLVDPRTKSRIGEYLRQGAVMNTKFEVFEDHIPHLLQFMLDSNLYGCGWVEVAKCKMRRPFPEPLPLSHSSPSYLDMPSCTGPFGSRVYDTNTIPGLFQHSPRSGPEKESHCPIEIDLSVSAILNRRLLSPRNLHHDFVEKLKPETITQDKLVYSVKELWDDERKRRMALGEKGPTVEVDDSKREWDDRPTHNPIWKSEATLRQKVKALARADLEKFNSQPGMESSRPTFESIVSDIGKADEVDSYLQSRIKTTFEQVDAIYPDRMRQDEMEKYEFGNWAIREWAQKSRQDPTPEPSQFPASFKVEASHMMVQSDEELDEHEAGVEEDGLYDVEMSVPRNGPVSDEEAQRRQAMAFASEERRAQEMWGDEAEEELEDKEAVKLDRELVDWHGDDNSERASSPASSDVAELKRTRSNTLDEEVEKVVLPVASFPVTSPTSHLASPLASSPAPSPSTARPPAPQRARINPFISRDKPVRVRFANDSTPSSQPIDLPVFSRPMKRLLRPDDEFIAQISSPPEIGGRTSEMEQINMELDDLPSDTFADDYVPTPTVVDLGSSNLPLHLRSDHIVSNEEEGGHSSLPSYDGSKEVASSVDSSATRKRVTFQVPDIVGSGDSSIIVESSSLGSESTVTNGERAFQTSSASTKSPELSLSVAIPIRKQHQLSPNSFVWALPPPSTAHLFELIKSSRRSEVVYRDPYYSNPDDVPKVAHVYGGRVFNLKADSIKYLPPFKHQTLSSNGIGQPAYRKRSGITSWEYYARPPAAKEMRDWLESELNASSAQRRAARISSQIEGPTQVNSGFNVVSAKGAASAIKEKQHLAILGIELHVNTRGRLLPDPSKDAISALFYCFQSDNEDLVSNGREPGRHIGIVAVGKPNLAKKIGKIGNIVVEVVETEYDLMDLLVQRVRNDWDPEIFAGYEVHHSSWGYLIERAQDAYGRCIADELGRIQRAKPTNAATAATDRWGFNQSTTLNFTGRHILPIWRILKEDVKLQQYTFENVVFHVLKRRTPHFSPETLSEWYNSGVPRKMTQVFSYWRNRVEMDLELIDEGEIISQTCEFARVFGVDFKSVRTRGSQFKVESVMARIAKPESFLLLSPNRADVGNQNAAECIPLIMEPNSAFFKGPLLVLDFQSLYPSVMIAYNYCYSTCLGRVDNFKGTQKLGISKTDLAPGILNLLQDDINISANGLMFVKPEIRKSLLAKMLTELLDTRVMVKSSMKGVKDDKALLKLMNARQLGLKLLANVTYGYTSATFSGRMPCVEIADAIVQTGRETLERALETIRATSKWGAEVVYGDTDSLFVYLAGRSKEEAFKIGQEIADVITSQNPRPIKLKFEKVYLPCLLLAKKRYVGFKYEHLSDVEPELDAKGIETIRRDNIPAVQKMQEHCLKLLFRTQDISLVKSYCQAQWKRLMLGNVSPQDFTYAKEVKMGMYSAKQAPPPGAAVSARKMKSDHRAAPEYGERVPYVIMEGEPGLKQVDRAIAPNEFLADPRIRLGINHYIKNAMIPPLQRIFNITGANVAAWYNEMPKYNRLIKRLPDVDTAGKQRVLLEEHFSSDRCIACEGKRSGESRLCDQCLSQPGSTVYDLACRTREIELRAQAIDAVCASCCSTPAADASQCDSLDCSVLYARKKNEVQIEESRALARLL